MKKIQSDALYRSALESTGDSIYVVDRECRYLYINTNHLQRLGLDPAHYIGTPYSATHDPADTKVFCATIEHIFATGESKEDDYEEKGRWFLRHFSPVVERGENQVLAVTLVSSEITNRKNAELAVQKSEAMYRSLVESTEDSIYLVDRECRYLYMNTNHLQRLGLDPAHYIGTPYSATHDPADTKVFCATIEHIFATGESKEDDYEEKGRWFLRHFSPVVERGESQVLAVTIVSSEITDRKSAELAAQKSEAMYRSLVESTEDSIYLVDRECRYLYMNTNHLQRLGLTPDLYKGLSYRNIHPKMDGNIFCAGVEKVFSTGVPVRDEYEREGQWFTRNLSPVKEPLRDGVSAVTIVSTEITERKRAEDELRLRNKYLTILNQIIGGSVKTSTIIDLMTTAVKKTSEMLDFDGGGIYLLDRHQRYESLAYHEGIPGDIISKIQYIYSSTGPFSTLYEDNGHSFIEDESYIPDSFQPLIARSMAFIPLHSGEQRIGSFFIFNRNDHRFAKEEREILESIGIEIGNALLKLKLQEELMQANIESNLYIDIMAHDINNANMTSILYAEMLAEMLEGEPKVYAKSMMQGIHKSSEIIKTVEVIRQIRETKSPLSAIDLDRVIATEIALFPEAVIHYASCQEKVCADYLISEIFTNLIGNSLKFGGPEIEIWIRVKVLGDLIEISVEDSGPGIADDLKPVIFNRFSRGDTTKYGKGLGLFIIKSLIDRYRGSIRVEDRIPGEPHKGAAIRFTLEKPPVRTV